MKPADLDIEFNKKSLKLRLIIMLEYKNIFSKVANQFGWKKEVFVLTKLRTKHHEHL